MAENFSKSITIVLGGLTSGGAERVASHLINYWSNQGWQINLIIGHESKYDFYNIPSNLNRIVINPGSPSSNKITALLKNIPYVWRLRRALKKIDSEDVISFLTRTNVHTILASIGLKKHVIISERNDTTRERHPWPWPQLRKILYRYADVVTANSEIALSGMEGYVSSEKLMYVPNPVYIPKTKANPSTSKTIINVGRLTSQKAQHLLIEALSLIKKSERDGWILNIFGVGEEEENLKKLAQQKQLLKTVNFCGLVKDKNIIYQGGAIFVLSSRYEGTPNALLEAMSYALPCIISDTILGANDLIKDGETGLIFSSGDSKDLAKKIIKLIDNPTRRQKIGNNSRKRVKIYSPSNVMPLWNKLLTE